MQNYHMTVVMAIDKNYAASGRPLQAESAASEIQREKMHSRKTAITNKSMNKRRFAVTRRSTQGSSARSFSSGYQSWWYYISIYISCVGDNCKTNVAVYSKLGGPGKAFISAINSHIFLAFDDVHS